MKRSVGSAVALLTVAIMLGACGGKAVSTDGAKTGTPAPAASADVSVDTKSKDLTVYTALEDDQIKTYLTTFKAKYPDVKVNIVRDSTGIVTAKLLAEKDNTQADVVWGLAATSLLVLDQNSMLEPYAPKGVERILPDFKDKNPVTHWVGIDAWETAFIVNKVEMEKRKLAIPQSYEDLVKPEYKGLITMPNPSSSGTGFLTVSGLVQLKGNDAAWDYMNKLHDNIAMYVHSGSKPAKLAGTGEYPIGISFGYRGIQEKKSGSPVEVVFPKEGSGWDVEANALMKKKVVKQVAKDFLDWAITDDVMKEYNKNYAILAIKTDAAKIPDGYTVDPVKQLIKNDLNDAAKKRDSVLAEWDKRFNAKSEPKK
ncbi:putative 2-aminoethylphosphonate ABC transporter substrate-binding protein [Paenibacillus aceris]|uniref:Iron(III) transport system substrate-binding protein n=1 Tax=Paenibacillus aceris TaxID=869555 RepID=A0ABS4HYU3_9BACL|nr:putative 2-aminoethylphosphonate ABC transporter substrate-binding protein [Paenibacillus aceris]MBP1963635.1 iron(III) transport system substrate-binding protein [Paenibacillus aceris]NHW36896.1 putative 2-aminoethylphosphonate ABC transporter substrate-binding protein [Paenibacillus aceris]